jgi:hypothetical protein
MRVSAEIVTVYVLATMCVYVYYVAKDMYVCSIHPICECILHACCTYHMCMHLQ